MAALAFSSKPICAQAHPQGAVRVASDSCVPVLGFLPIGFHNFMLAKSLAQIDHTSVFKNCDGPRNMNSQLVYPKLQD